jgi:hypothetical protein
VQNYSEFQQAQMNVFPPVPGGEGSGFRYLLFWERWLYKTNQSTKWSLQQAAADHPQTTAEKCCIT